MVGFLDTLGLRDFVELWPLLLLGVARVDGANMFQSTDPSYQGVRFMFPIGRLRALMPQRWPLYHRCGQLGCRSFVCGVVPDQARASTKWVLITFMICLCPAQNLHILRPASLPCHYGWRAFCTR